MEALTLVEARTYEDMRLPVDGGRFVRCKFINSKLIYYAEEDVSFEECIFENCDWVFEAAAERAFRFLSMLQQQGGDQGQGVVAATIAAIQAGITSKKMVVIPSSDDMP